MFELGDGISGALSSLDLEPGLVSGDPELTADKEKPISPCALKNHTREALTQSVGALVMEFQDGLYSFPYSWVGLI